MKYALLGTTLGAAFLAVSTAHAAAVSALPKPAVGCDQWHMGDDERQRCYGEWNAAKSDSDRIAVEHKYNHAAKIPASAKPAPPPTPVDRSVGENGPIAPPSARGTSPAITPKVNNRAASGNHTE